MSFLQHPYKKQEVIKYAFFADCGKSYENIPYGTEVFFTYQAMPFLEYLKRHRPMMYQGLEIIPEEKGVRVKKVDYPLLAKFTDTGLSVHIGTNFSVIGEYGTVVAMNPITMNDLYGADYMLTKGMVMHSDNVSFLHEICYLPSCQYFELSIADRFGAYQNTYYALNQLPEIMDDAQIDTSISLYLTTFAEGIRYTNHVFDKKPNHDLNLSESNIVPWELSNAIHQFPSPYRFERHEALNETTAMMLKPKIVEKTNKEISQFLRLHKKEIMDAPGYSIADEPLAKWVLVYRMSIKGRYERYYMNMLEPKYLSIEWEDIPENKRAFVFWWMKVYDARNKTHLADHVTILPSIVQKEWNHLKDRHNHA